METSKSNNILSKNRHKKLTIQHGYFVNKLSLCDVTARLTNVNLQHKNKHKISKNRQWNMVI